MIKLTILPISILLFSVTACVGQGDILIADFEKDGYGSWQVEGNAFGQKPANGTLENQQEVSGFRGKGLVNTYLGGDEATGTITSPEFKIQRKFINFLIGGGDSRRTRIELLIGDQVERTASGRESEALDWENWDVSEYIGKTAQIRIVDRSRGGWGHILIDHIYQGNARRGSQFHN
ncbi:MAG: hypothetical protein ACYSUX_17365 [Planctomycetota bacterium]|jgi:hypothetical protein